MSFFFFFFSKIAASHIATSYDADQHEWKVLYYIAAFSLLRVRRYSCLKNISADPRAARSKARMVLDSSKTGIVGSNPARGIVVQGVLPKCLNGFMVSEVNSESEQVREHSPCETYKQRALHWRSPVHSSLSAYSNLFIWFNMMKCTVQISPHVSIKFCRKLLWLWRIILCNGVSWMYWALVQGQWLGPHTPHVSDTR